MDQSEKSKQFLFKYFREMMKANEKGSEALKATMHRFIEDQKLIDHIIYLNKSFPNYSMTLEEIIAEGNKVFVRVNFVGTHKGVVDNIPATHKEVNVPFALCYTIENDKIVDFWAISDQVDFFEQLGLEREKIEVALDKN